MKRIFKYCRFVFSLSKKYFFINLLYNAVVAVAWIMINISLKLLTETIVVVNLEHQILRIGIPILLYFVCAILLGGSFYNLERIISINLVRKSIEKLILDFSNVESKIKHDLFYDSKFYNEYNFSKKNQIKIIEITTLIMNNAIVSILNILFSAISIIYFDIYIFIMLLTISVISFLLNNYIAKRNYKKNKELIFLEREINYFSSLLSERSNSKEIRIFSLSNILLPKWENKFEQYLSQRKTQNKKNNNICFFIGILELLMNFVFVVYLVSLIMRNKISSSDAVFLQGTFWVLSFGINSLITLLSKNISESLRFIVDYDNFIEKNDSFKSLEDTITIDNSSGFKFENIELKNVSYKYPYSNEYVLKNINIKINNGEVVCLIGDNGSGKTTISKILCGLLENYTGEVLINGIDIKKFDKKILHSFFAVAFQEFNRYSISFKDNILIGDINKTKENDYNEVVKKAHLEEIINNLPDKENTLLGKEYCESGTDLSLGQWQRVILARAYIKHASLLILDEPTASIDPKEEVRIISSFNELIKNAKATLLITHRLGFAKMSDKIIVMKDGKIVESGEHKDLIQMQGEYRAMYFKQKDLYE